MIKPIILIGGSNLYLGKFNGGVKHLNLWTKIIRENGYEAYLVTQNGTFESWLIEHQPVISYAKAEKWRDQNRNLKSIPMWLPVIEYYLKLTKQIYFYDCEVAKTCRSRHFTILQNLLSTNKIRAIGTNSRYNQNWYKSTINYSATMINEWSDAKYWFPKPEMREKNLVGYTKERKSDVVIQTISEICHKQGFNFRFIKIEGLEEIKVLDLLRKCDFFLGTNPGKHPIHGEGCPRVANEAMHAGCIVISFDVNGNREYLQDGKTGFLIPQREINLMAKKLIFVANHPVIKEQIRENSINFALEKFSAPERWEKIRDFLELE